jgi:long-subunit acyl-CoA synthetase (AMP-forming)
MTQVTRLFDFPYYQQDKYTSIPDALNTKQDGVWIKTSTQEYIEQANAVSRALLRMGIKKMIKSPLFLQATERNGILWILVFYKRSAKRPYTQQSLKMIMNTY